MLDLVLIAVMVGELRAARRLRRPLRPTVRESAMTFDYTLAAAVTAGLLVYLGWALVRPERF